MFFKTETTEQRIRKFLGGFGVRVYMDNWSFGLLMSDSSIVLISTIKSITRDGNWITVEMKQDDTNVYKPKDGVKAIYAHNERTTAAINTRHIMGILEMADI